MFRGSLYIQLCLAIQSSVLKVQHGSRKTFALPLNIFLRHWIVWSSSLKSLIFINALFYSDIYLYIYIYFSQKKKKKSSYLQRTTVTSTRLSEKIGTGDAPMGEKGLQPSITCQGSSEMTWHSAGQGQQF